ncbi:MAG: hypothetical protein IPL12_03510 [Bacteroidetes bacterium]|nr:hypothetical protein [Bacteroidota bacterium]
MKKLTKWDMIKEAMEHSNGPTTYSDIKHFIVNKWGDINKRTIEAEIIGLIVNHNSRIHYGINKKPRLTNTDSPYDFLYEIKRGVVEKYSIERHGLWEIYEDEHKILKVRIIYKPKIFTPFDITWVKNVSNTEIGVAYLDIGGNEFILDYPAKHTGNILSTAIN